MVGNPAGTRWLGPRVLGLLALTAVLECLAALWALSSPGSWWPYAGTLAVNSLPGLICGVAVGLAALTAPLLSAPEDDWRPARSGFAALWQTAALIFGLLVAARLVPLENEGVVLAAGAFFASAAGLTLLADSFPRIYSGIVFVWLIGLPVLSYFLAELRLSADGGADWRAGATPTALETSVHWLLNLSPGTATVAALSGTLADGSRFSAPAFLFFAAGLAVLLLAGLWRKHARKVSAIRAAAGPA